MATGISTLKSENVVIVDGCHKMTQEECASHTFKQKIMRLRGEANDSTADCDGAYYGVALYGWDEGKNISDSEIELLRKFVKIQDIRSAG